MITIKQPKTLKVKLSLYFSIIAIVPSFLISIFYYYYSTNSLKRTMVNDAKVNEAYIIDNIDNQLKVAEKLSDWMFLNRSLEKVLVEYNLDKPQFDSELISVNQIIENTVLDSSISQDISSIIISGDNGVDLRYGDDAAIINKSELESAQWFKDSLSKEGAVYFQGIVKNLNVVSHDDYILPIVRPIIHSTLETNIGWSFIALKESLISNVYKKFYEQNKNPIYIVDNKGVCISSSDKNYIGKTVGNYDFIKPVLNADQSGYFDIKKGKKVSLVVFSESNLTGWKIVQKISYAPLYEQKIVILRMSSAIFLGSILICFIFTMFLSSNLSKPLQKILKKMRLISRGDFQRDFSLEGDDEMGELGIGINELAGSISDLLRKVKKEEAEKRNLELLVLQSQVNPHFLYNTLNSIKWMATVQKADGIRDMVSALGRLLMNISKEKSEEISIRREVALTEDYIFIQNVRYNGKIKVQYDVKDESLLENQIVKFTLQPIVENAIFHGIEPKKESGNIKIEISEKDESVLLCIEDDGVGISQRDINNIFISTEKHNNRGLRSIGIKNVDDRLKLFYGKDYGLSIESEIGIYTRVNIKIPKSHNNS